MITDRNIFILDTETTGLDEPKIVEIAWVAIDPDFEILDSFTSLVDPEKPISASASATHNLVYEDVAEAPTIEELFSIVLPDPITGVFQISHNVKFDYALVKDHMEVVGTFDTLRASRRLYPGAENHQLNTLKYELGLRKDQEAHRALDDVMVTYDLLKKMVTDSGHDLAGFIAEFSKPVFVEKVAFGKHKGQDFRTVPTPYLEWILSCDFDEDVVFTVRTILAERGLL